MTLYDVLQVSRFADQDMIRTAWASLSKRYHPDRSDGGDPEKARAVNEAYQVLKDPKRRAEYDLTFERPHEVPRTGSQPHQYQTPEEEFRETLRNQKRKTETERPMPQDFRRGRYPAAGAYPDPYPGVPFERAFGEVYGNFEEAIRQAVDNAQYDLLEKLARNNPILRVFLENQKRGAARKKKTS